MRKELTAVSLCLCGLALAGSASCQSRKAGLWELSTTMTWQQSPISPDLMAKMPAGSPFGGGGAQTSQICLTQEQIDKFGAVVPQSRIGCSITNVVKGPNSMSAEMVCTGRLTGKAEMHSSWTDEDHATGKMHFLGAMQMGTNTRPMEWTSESVSVYKGADCGSVKPLPMPADK